MLAALVVDDPERALLVARGEPVEPVEGPVEVGQVRPPEAVVRRAVVGAVAEQVVARREELGVDGYPSMVPPGAPASKRARDRW